MHRKLFYSFWEADGHYAITNKHQKKTGRIFFPFSAHQVFICGAKFLLITRAIILLWWVEPVWVAGVHQSCSLLPVMVTGEWSFPVLIPPHQPFFMLVLGMCSIWWRPMSGPLFVTLRTTHLLLSRGVLPVHLLPAAAGLSPGLSRSILGSSTFWSSHNTSASACWSKHLHWDLSLPPQDILLTSCNYFPSRSFPSFCNGLVQLTDTQDLG